MVSSKPCHIQDMSHAASLTSATRPQAACAAHAAHDYLAVEELVSPDQPWIEQLAARPSQKQYRRAGPVVHLGRPGSAPDASPPGPASSGRAILEVRNTSEVEDGVRHVWLPPRPLDSVPSERGMVMGPDPIRCVIAAGGSLTSLPRPISMPFCCPTGWALENRQDNGEMGWQNSASRPCPCPPSHSLSRVQ